jgi:hypothetical protein
VASKAVDAAGAQAERPLERCFMSRTILGLVSAGVVTIGLLGCAPEPEATTEAASSVTRSRALQTTNVEERDLLVVSNLTTHGSADYAWLYAFIEVSGVALAQSQLSDSYKSISVLSGADASFGGFEQALSTMTARPEEKALDVFVHLHGSPGALWFEDGMKETSSIRTALAAQPRVGAKLRALYSTACYGGSHMGDFLASGFRVANGARAVNANAAYDYPTVLGRWRDGETFQDAQNAGNDPGQMSFYDGIASWQGFSDVDSFKLVEGQGDATINAIHVP